MDPDRDRPAPWSRAGELVTSTRRTLRRRGLLFLARSPRPVQQMWRLTERTARETIDDRVPGLAAEVALFTLISLPALLLVILGSFGFIAAALGPDGLQEMNRLVLDVPQSFLSDRTFNTYERVAMTAMEQQRGSVVSLAAALSLWTGSRAVNRYLETITIAYDVPPRPAWRRRLVALALTVGGLVGAVAILPPLVAGERLVEWLVPDAVADATLRVAGVLFWPGLILLIVIGLATTYHIGVPWRTPWRRDFPGAVLAMVLWLGASAGLRAYLDMTLSGGGVYSQLAVPIAVVLWLYLTAFAVLLGAELNAEIEKMWPHREHPWRLPWRGFRRSAAREPEADAGT
ncbi:YihY/virulence factor BrkB family protein [Mycolicibacterium palauense]|uniref:YihY/virulence factor BrkB family protein n=1 Tax=Mycolicibacterium palauense TaxID=2034511 RepID=UPI000BFED57D|nr:YihY/virulence factor BrkB family protein [Mycolicibacterium palauense]